MGVKDSINKVIADRQHNSSKSILAKQPVQPTKEALGIPEHMRTFKSGAVRDSDQNKPDYSGYLSPRVIRRFGEYMLEHQTLSDGCKRGSDNWKAGMDKKVYMASAWRHFMAVWLHHEGCSREAGESLEDALCGVIFNIQGYLLEVLKEF